ARPVSERPTYRVDGRGAVRRACPPRGDRAWAAAPLHARRPRLASLMKITEARTIVVGTPWRDLAFLELATDTGLVGTSEARMVNRTGTLLACLEELAPRYVIGSDPFDVERLSWNILRAEYGRAGEITQSALASFDVACWDL